MVRGLLEAGYVGDFDVELIGREIEHGDYETLLRVVAGVLRARAGAGVRWRRPAASRAIWRPRRVSVRSVRCDAGSRFGRWRRCPGSLHLDGVLLQWRMPRALIVTDDLVIPAAELQATYVAAPGPGGRTSTR